MTQYILIYMKTINGIEFYSVKELAGILQLSTITILKYCRDKTKLNGVRIGKFYFVSKENLNKFLKGE